jgi:molybdenum cofactor biosynthesis enzyme
VKEKNMKKLTHVSETGKANMVDVSNKPDQVRVAKATGHITLNPETLELIRENKIKKGDVLTIAEIAGIQGGKRTSELIPLCHPLLITRIAVKAETDATGVRINAEAKQQFPLPCSPFTTCVKRLIRIWLSMKSGLLKKQNPRIPFNPCIPCSKKPRNAIHKSSLSQYF